MGSHYEQALICENGHMITSSLDTLHANESKFCDKCGAKTISKCPNCNEYIRGAYIVPGVISVSPTPVRSYCHNCGCPYPWTQKALQSFDELMEIQEGLSEDEAEDLKKSIRDIISDNPKTEIAIIKLKRAVKKIAPDFKNAFIQLITNLATEAAKKQLGL